GRRPFRTFVFDVHPLVSNIVVDSGSPDAQVIVARKHVRNLERAVRVGFDWATEKQGADRAPPEYAIGVPHGIVAREANVRCIGSEAQGNVFQGAETGEPALNRSAAAP